MNKPEPRRVSASRLKTLDSCSMLFYLSEILKLPQKIWPRTIIGSLAHAILECLYRKKHRHHHDIIKSTGTIYSSAAVARLVKRWQIKHSIAEDLIADVDAMIILVLTQTNFLDEGATRKFQPEHEFRMTLKNRAIIKGFLDRFAIFDDKARIIDYKSQRNRFTKEEVIDSFQSLVYQLFLWKEYGMLAEVVYVLLRHPPTKKMPDKHLQITPPATPAVLAGFESYLEHMYNVINNFTFEDACSKWHSDTGFCDRVCSYRRPMDYHAIRHKTTGELIRTTMIDNPPKLGENEVMSIEHFGGCVRWNS